MTRFCLLAVLLIPGTALAQITYPGCGNENESACGPGDSEYYANNPGRLSPCDFGLTQSGDTLGFGGTCINGSAYSYQPRWTQSFNTSWTGWAMAQQRYGIGGDTPMNFITTIGTHNSFSNLDGGFSNVDSQDQIMSITDQLQLGARYIRLDERYYEGQMRLCHGSNTLCAVLSSTISPGRLFANAVKEVANWLAQNPSEFIILDLNGDPQGNSSLVIDPILTYIGASKIVTTSDANCLAAGATCVFPSLNTVRNAGKQVLILTASYQDPNFTFSRNLLDEKDPFDPTTTTQIFGNCEDGQTNLMRYHASNIWPYTSEDRSGSVLFVDPTKFLGFLDEAEVQTAANCGYAIIAFDFLNNRSHTYPEDSSEYSTFYPSLTTFPAEVTTDTPDNRFASSIWSFDSNDSGAHIYAFMQANSRWSTAPDTSSKNYACSDAPLNSFTANPNWHVTSTSGAFEAGETTCVAEGNQVGQSWHFAHPVNGWQNLDLFAATRGATPWVNYKVQAVPNFAVAPISMGAVIQQGGAAPASQQILVGGPPNASVIISAIPVGSKTTNLNWLQLPSTLALILDADGAATTNLGFTSAVAGLTPGIYQANVVFTVVGGATVTSVTASTVAVALIVKTTPQVVLSCSGNSAQEDAPYACSVLLNDPNTSTALFPGTVSMKQISTDSNGQTVTTTIQQRGVSPTDHTAVFSLLLPQGNFDLVATYSGDDIYNVATSQTWPVAVLPYLAAAPLSESTSFPQGQPLSAQALTYIDYNNSSGATATVSCTTSPCWMHGVPDVNPANPKLNREDMFLLSSIAATLAPGTYTGNVAIADGIHTTLNIPITLNVQTSLTLGDVANLVASKARVPGYMQVSAASGSNIPIAVTTNQNWLTATVASGAPTTIGLLADPTGLAPGNYSAQVSVSSPLAPTLTKTVYLDVVPLTTVTTSPPGLPITVDSVNYTSPQSFVLDPQLPHSIGTSATAVLAGNTQYSFHTWSDGGALSHNINPPKSSGETSTWTANFNVAAYLVDITGSPSNYGKVVLSPTSSNGFYAPGSQITATATPADNYVFSNFTGDVSGPANPQKFNVNSPISATALFTSPPSTILTPTGTPQSADVGAYFPTPLSVLVTDAARNPLPFVLVVFISPATGPSTIQPSFTTITNASGVATFNAIANSFIGTYTVSAEYGGYSAPFLLSNIPNFCDVTLDGKMTVADVQSVVNQAVGGALSVSDLNGDGVVNVVDVQIAVNGVLSGSCMASQ